MTRKALIIIFIVLAGLFLLYKLADMFSPGSYGHAERYRLDYPEEKVIESIKKFKNNNKEFLVPKVTIQKRGQLNLEDGRMNETDYWYNFYFYDKKNNQILMTWTRSSERNTTTFAFVAVNKGLNLENWKEINYDLGFFENREVKKYFKKTILNKIKKDLSNN